MNYYLGLDVGGTAVKMGLFDEYDNLVEKINFPTRTVEYLVDDIYQNIVLLFNKNNLSIDEGVEKWNASILNGIYESKEFVNNKIKKKNKK